MWLLKYGLLALGLLLLMASLIIIPALVMTIKVQNYQYSELKDHDRQETERAEKAMHQAELSKIRFQLHLAFCRQINHSPGPDNQSAGQQKRSPKAPVTKQSIGDQHSLETDLAAADK